MPTTDNAGIHPLKHLWVLSASFGAAFALTLAVIVGVFMWYGHRPKAWNVEALKGTFRGVDLQITSRENYQVEFIYDVKNNTGGSYEFNAANLTVMAKLSDSGSLSKELGHYQTTDPVVAGPAFIPPQSTARFAIQVTYRVPLSSNETLDETKTNKSFNHRLKELSGFVVFDNTKHYRLDLPEGWQQWASIKQIAD